MHNLFNFTLFICFAFCSSFCIWLRSLRNWDAPKSQSTIIWFQHVI